MHKCLKFRYLQLEECIRNLQHQHMGMVVLMTHQNALASPSHTMKAIVLFEALQPCQHRRILFWLRLLGTKGVVRQGIQADGFRLLCGEVLG